MKRHILTLLAALTIIYAGAQVRISGVGTAEKGEPSDRLRYVINYEFSFVNDTTKTPYNVYKEPMLLETGDKMTAFYSYAAYQSDSVNAAIRERGGTQFHASYKISWRVYKDYPEKGKYTYTDAVGLEDYACVRRLDTPEWTLCPDSSATILGYGCRLATAYYKGRQWSAWYAEDIPLSEGPWLLSGLPGLVLSAYDDAGQFRFEANGMRQVGGEETIYYKGKDYEKVSWKDMLDLYRRYNADPIGYVTTAPNVKVMVTDENGNPLPNPKDQPYNLIDKSK